MQVYNGITIEDESEVQFVYSGLLHFTDSLGKYQSWIKTKEGKPLLGMETAISEMQKEIAAIQKLQLRMYHTCFEPRSRQ